MVKPLLFKGDKKPKKRKRAAAEDEDKDVGATSSSGVARITDSLRGASATASSAVVTTSSSSAAAAADDDDSWTSAEATTDISGPVLFVLASEPPSCIACDANGTVFASTVENIVDGNAATAEPHDVRQVWVANRVAGTESFSFKGHHGR